MKKIRALLLAGILLVAGASAAFADGLSLKKYEAGLTHDDVKVIQSALRMDGVLALDASTDFYGPMTEKAVSTFQEKYGLQVDGVAGGNTLHKLYELGYLKTLTQKAYKEGESHEDIQLLQRILVLEGLLKLDETTAYYGPKTKAAVEAFQDKYSLTVDGVAGQETIEQFAALGYILPPGGQAPVVIPPISRSGERRFGEYIDWTDMAQLIDKMETVFVIEDFRTGITWNMQASYGGVHSDVEPLTAEDAAIMKAVWGGKWSWIRRPVLVHHQGRIMAASLNGMPHAGLENQPEGATVSNRSAGFGRGYNFDDVKGNTVDGHFCLHFRGSKLHSNRSVDNKHQTMVRVAAGLETE